MQSERGDSVRAGGGGIGIFSLLGLLFIGLKLAGQIDWSWLWVLAPFWIPWAFCITLFLIVASVVIFVGLFARTLK